MTDPGAAEPGAWVIVSGSRGSLGSAVAEVFLARGRRVLALDRERDHDGGAAHPRLTERSVDLALSSDVRLAVDTAIPRTDRIDLLVNSVGLIWNEPVLKVKGGTFQTHDEDAWRNVIESNLTAAFLTASHVAARMARRGGGVIVNFSSISARGNAGQAAYAAAKAGIEGMTRSMAAELGPLGIRVNALALGFVDTVSTGAALSEDQRRAAGKRAAVGRLGRIDEVMQAIDFLAGNEFVTGSIVAVDGGVRI